MTRSRACAHVFAMGAWSPSPRPTPPPPPSPPPPPQVCPYQNVQQDWTTLGTYSTFAPVAPGLDELAARLPLQALLDASLGTEPGKGVLGHRVMTFVEGASCHTGVARYVCMWVVCVCVCVC
jgi:hypothetical protein